MKLPLRVSTGPDELCLDCEVANLGIFFAAPKEESKPEEKKTEEKGETSARSKRASILGSLFQKVSPQNEKEKETPAKSEETPAVSNTAPQLGDPVAPAASEPIKPETVTQPPASENKEGGAAKEGGSESASSPLSKAMNFIKKEMKHDVCCRSLSFPLRICPTNFGLG